MSGCVYIFRPRHLRPGGAGGVGFGGVRGCGGGNGCGAGAGNDFYADGGSFSIGDSRSGGGGGGGGSEGGGSHGGGGGGGGYCGDGSGANNDI